LLTITRGSSIFLLHLSGKFGWVKAPPHPWDAINRVPYNIVYPDYFAGCFLSVVYFRSLYFTMRSYHKSVSAIFLQTKRCTVVVQRRPAEGLPVGERGVAVGPWDRNMYSFALGVHWPVLRRPHPSKVQN
jgi:hypothetical protein